MAHLASQELQKRGDMYGLVKRKTSPYGCDMFEYVWMDKDHRQFIASGSSMDAGANMERIRSRQLEDVSKNADPMDVTLTIPQPTASDIYYGACSKIDQHNICRQEYQDIENKLQTHDWDKKSNLGIFAMCVVDAWMCYSNKKKVEETQEAYYLKISEEMLDNLLDANLVTRIKKKEIRHETLQPVPTL